MSKLKLETVLKENMMKNLIIVVLVFLFYGPIHNSASGVSVEAIADFLLIVSILIVTASTANFAFTYEKVKINSIGSRLLAHSATFVFMLLVALLLETMVIVIGSAYPSFYQITIVFSILLYVGIVLYDFWDLFRKV